MLISNKYFLSFLNFLRSLIGLRIKKEFNLQLLDDVDFSKISLNEDLIDIFRNHFLDTKVDLAYNDIHNVKFYYRKHLINNIGYSEEEAMSLNTIIEEVFCIEIPDIHYYGLYTFEDYNFYLYFRTKLDNKFNDDDFMNLMDYIDSESNK